MYLSSSVLVEDCIFEENSSLGQSQSFAGGAIFHPFGGLTVKRSTFDGNIANLEGKEHIDSVGGTLVCEDNTFINPLDAGAPSECLP